jgi:ABC-type Na+ efflux pump permease subunit
MATSTGKTIGLIILALIVLFLVFMMTPVAFLPFAIFPGVFHIFRIPSLSHLWGEHGPFALFRFAASSLLSLALLILWIIVIVWVYRDAERKGMNGILWALLVLIGNLIGLLIYLIVRSERVPAKRSVQTTTCPSCQKTVEAGFVFCPNCGARLQAVCPGCNKPVDTSWKVCPNCGERLSK